VLPCPEVDGSQVSLLCFFHSSLSERDLLLRTFEPVPE